MWEAVRIIVLGIFLFMEGIRDFKRHRIAMWSVFLFAVVGIALGIPEGMSVWRDMAAGITVGLVVLVLAKITEGKIGFGDGWVLMVTGLYLGFRGNLFLFMTALFVSAVTSVILLLSRRADKKTELPFVSFLFISYILTIAI